jgi:hypothetical protein
MPKRIDHLHAEKALGHERRRRTIPRDFSGSLMSDTKWRKVFEAVRAQPDIKRLVVRFVYGDREHEIGVPSLQCPHAWADFFEFGPEPLREIEWLEIPRRYFPKLSVAADQDVEALRRALDAIGRFPLEDTERGLRVVGHRP